MEVKDRGSLLQNVMTIILFLFSFDTLATFDSVAFLVKVSGTSQYPSSPISLAIFLNFLRPPLSLPTPYHLRLKCHIYLFRRSPRALTFTSACYMQVFRSCKCNSKPKTILCVELTFEIKEKYVTYKQKNKHSYIALTIILSTILRH